MVNVLPLLHPLIIEIVFPMKNEECAQRFNMFQSRTVVLERKVETRGLGATEFFGLLNYKHLHILSNMENEVFVE